MVTLNDAMKVISAAQKKAAALGQPMNVAVADDGGNLVAHVRMDGAWIGSVGSSIKKAFTARVFGITASNGGRIMIFAGGVPLTRAGKVVGAVGVSGGSGEQDQAVAEAGAAAFD
jgi:uncharacterized protein GlcG (DUF336 family)